MADEEHQQSEWEPSDKVLPEYEGLAEAIQLISEVLHLCTGLNNFERRLVGYYAAATHYIEQYSVFPGLMAYGTTSSGKSQVLDVLEASCHRPTRLTEKTSTDAALRAAMKESNRGTLILEEAGELKMEDIEGVLTTRYGKSSAQTAKMEQADGEGRWELDPAATYGATVIHRQFSVRKPMLQRRLISVHTFRQRRAEPFIKFLELTEKEDGISPEILSKKVHDCFSTLPIIPKVRQQWGDVESGILDAYAPLIAIAVALEDEEFIREIIHEAKDKSAELIEDESSLELPTILRTIVLLVREKYSKAWISDTEDYSKTEIPDRLSIDVSDIEPTIRKEYGSSHPALLLSHTQRNRIIRSDFKFVVKSSGGKVRVFLTLGMLVKVCDKYGLQDSAIDSWRKGSKE